MTHPNRFIGKSTTAQLKDEELNGVAGGSPTDQAKPIVMPSPKPNSADKAFAVYDAYIRS